MGVLGTCAGSGAMLSSLADFTFMKKDHSALYLNSANTIDGKVSELIQGSSFNAGVAGVVDVISVDDQTLLSDIRLLIDVLPSHNKEEAPLGIQTDDMNRMLLELNDELFDGLDGRSLLSQMVDFGTFLELKPSFGTDIVTGIGRIGGITAGFIASQSRESDARLTLNGCQKITEFVTKLDAFNLPIITLIDIVGFSATLEETKAGQSKYVAHMMNAFIGATVPKINIIANRAIGSAYVALNSKHIGADIVYAWPNAQVAVMEAEPAVRIMYAKDIESADIAADKISELIQTYKEEHMSPYAAASRGYIDDIIEPSSTRKRVIAALDMLFTKYVVNPDRKHRSV
jgi:acetyl-CoA carboxylase carboxyltransferase component